jgi:hypothetical protein
VDGLSLALRLNSAQKRAAGALPTNANVGGDGFVDVAANIIYPGGGQSALEAHLSINIPGAARVQHWRSSAVLRTPAWPTSPCQSMRPWFATRAKSTS